MDSITTQSDKSKTNRPRGASRCDAVQPCGRLSLKNLSKYLPYLKKDIFVDCRYIINQAIKKGVLQKPESCSLCERTGIKINAHHEDYRQPLKVIWLCNRCHIRVYHHNRPFEDDPPTPKQDKHKPYKSSDYTDSAQIFFGDRNHHIPILKDSPYQLCGLLLEENIEDEHQYFAETYNWNILLNELSFREREIVTLRYGLNGDRAYTLKEIGKILKYTRTRIGQIEAKAINRLRRLINHGYYNATRTNSA